MTKKEAIKKCFDNICKNFDTLANLHVSKPMRDCNQRDIITAFVDIHVGSSFSFLETAELQQFIKNGILSKKDYRRFRALIRIRLVETLWSIRNLADEGLRNLGAANV